MGRDVMVKKREVSPEGVSEWNGSITTMSFGV